MQYASCMSNSVDYRRTETYSKTHTSFLDPHHTHFILVDSYDSEKQNSEIEFRSKFESRDIYGIPYIRCLD